MYISSYSPVYTPVTNNQVGKGGCDECSEPLQKTEPKAEKQQEQIQQQQELKVIRELAARDREVRAHEQAHAAVGGQYAGAPSYTYERGPDGRMYAVGGEVSIDISKVPNDPQATIQKADQIRRAALAPAEPSPQDRAVAAEAGQMKLQAQQELAAEVSEKESVDSQERTPVRDGEQSQSLEMASSRDVLLGRAILVGEN